MITAAAIMREDKRRKVCNANAYSAEKFPRHFKRRFFSGVLDYAEKLLTIFALRVKTLIGMLSAD